MGCNRRQTCKLNSSFSPPGASTPTLREHTGRGVLFAGIINDEAKEPRMGDLLSAITMFDEDEALQEDGVSGLLPEVA